LGLIAAQTLGERATQLILRTFHTGGAAVAFSVASLLKTIPSAFTVQKNQIYAADDVEFSVPADGMKITEDGIVISKQTLHVKSTKEIDWELPFLILIPESRKTKELTPGGASFEFKKGDLVGAILFKSQDINEAITQITKSLSSPPQDYNLFLWNTFEAYRMAKVLLPLVHFELLTSIMARSGEDDSIQWRLRQSTTPHLVPYDQVVRLESAVLGIAFSNPYQGILAGLTKPHSDREKSSLEELITL
jgi:RNA polymerase Rpb1, domain 5